jgi:hypothetical protein
MQGGLLEHSKFMWGTSHGPRINEHDTFFSETGAWAVDYGMKMN